MLSQPPDYSRKYVPQPDEPIDCMRCGLTPASAMKLRCKPALLVAPGLICCESCSGTRPYSAAEELEKLKAREGEGQGPCRAGFGDWYQVYLELIHRPHEPGSSSNSSRRKDVAGGLIRSDQEWHGFPQRDTAETLKLEKFKFTVKGALPRWMRQRWAEQAEDEGYTDSRLMRWFFHQHLRGLSDVPELERGPKGKSRFKLLVTESHYTILVAKKAALSEALGRDVSSPEIVAAVLLEEWT